MKKFFKIIIPIILVLVILASIGWYLFIYDRDFTRDMLLQGARYFDAQGNHAISAWFYDKAYEQAVDNDAVAIELAEQMRDSVKVYIIIDNASGKYDIFNTLE